MNEKQYTPTATISHTVIAPLAFWLIGIFSFRWLYGAWPPMQGKFGEWLASDAKARWSMFGALVIALVCSMFMRFLLPGREGETEIDRLIHHGHDCHNRGEMQAALESFNLALTKCEDPLNPDAGRIRGSLGKLYFDMGELAKATDNVKIARQIYARYPGESKAKQHIDALLNVIQERSQISSKAVEYIDPGSQFSLQIPVGWIQQKLVDKFQRTGGKIAVSHSSYAATLNVSTGKLDRPEWRVVEVRASSAEDFLTKMPNRVSDIELTTGIPLAGEENAVTAECDTRHPVGGTLHSRRTGFISVLHRDIEYVIQWSAEPQLEPEVRGILNSFTFL